MIFALIKFVVRQNKNWFMLLLFAVLYDLRSHGPAVRPSQCGRLSVRLKSSFEGTMGHRCVAVSVVTSVQV